MPDSSQATVLRPRTSRNSTLREVATSSPSCGERTVAAASRRLLLPFLPVDAHRRQPEREGRLPESADGGEIERKRTRGGRPQEAPKIADQPAKPREHQQQPQNPGQEARAHDQAPDREAIATEEHQPDAGAHRVKPQAK